MKKESEEKKVVYTKTESSGEQHKKKIKVSRGFVTALSIVSILGFLGIIIESFFSFETGDYIEASLMIIIGLALIIEAKVKKLRTLAKGFNSSNFTHLVTAIIGGIAIVAGIFSIPYIRIETSAFQAIKGILSIIAIIVIAVQTWVVE